MKNDSWLGRVVWIDEVLERLRRERSVAAGHRFHSRVLGDREGCAGCSLSSIVPQGPLGGLIFRTGHIGTPFHGVAASIFVAFVSAVALLLILRLIRRSTPRRL